MSKTVLAGPQAAHVVRVLAAARRHDRPLVGSFRAAAAVDEVPEAKAIAERIEGDDDLALLDAVERALAAGPDRAAQPVLAAVRRAGSPADGLEGLARWLRRRGSARSYARAVLVYPFIVLFLAAIVHVALMPILLGVFSELFEGLGANLPGLTRFVLRAYGVGVPAGWIIPAIWVGVLLLLAVGIASVALNPHRTAVAASTPFLSRLVRTEAARSYCGILIILLRARVPMPEALRLAAAGVENPRLRARLDGLAETAERGEGIGEALRRADALPAAAAWRLWSAYYRSGLEDELETVVADSERDLAIQAQGVGHGFQILAVLLVVLSVVPIPIAVVGMYLPMFSLISQIG